MKSALSRSAKPPTVKRESTSVKSGTDWARLESKAKPAQPSDEHPEADVRHIVRGVVRRGLQPLPSKASISPRVDQDVLEWFKAQGPGYQTRINTVLRAFRDAWSEKDNPNRFSLSSNPLQPTELIERKDTIIVRVGDENSAFRIDGDSLRYGKSRLTKA